MKKALFSVLLLFGCIFTTAQPVMANGETVEVSIKKFKFTPKEITVKVGTAVRWVNNEKRQYHSVWFEASGEEASEYFFPGESYERRFDKSGTFSYTCEPHPEMLGVVNVVE